MFCSSFIMCSSIKLESEYNLIELYLNLKYVGSIAQN